MEFDESVARLLRRGPGRMIPDLDRIARLSELMGDPQRAYPSVHITGTNGKTSVTRAVTTLFSAAGLSAGTYTSPHLQTVRERLSVAGRRISEREFAEVFEQLAPLVQMVDDELEHPDDHVTYFEFVTAMAYWWFADKPVDVGVFEVGMGGRWDATNLVRGEVAVLTPIDVDHKELGATAVEVAKEKVGIIKPGATVVSGRQRDDVLQVIRATCREQDATLWVQGDDFEVQGQTLAVGGQIVTLRVGDRTLEDVQVPLFGAHQADNAAVALAAFAAFTGQAFHEMDEDVIRQGFTATTVPGRMEVVHREPTVVLDGAHNPHGARTAAGTIDRAFDFRNLVLVISCLDDKDVAGIVGAFRDVANHVVVCEAPSRRTADLERIQEAARRVWEGSGVIVETAESVGEALDKATGVAGPGDGVLVTGSLYTVGAARDRYVPVEDDGDEVVYEPDDIDDDEDEDAFNDALNDMIDRLDEDARGTDDDES